MTKAPSGNQPRSNQLAEHYLRAAGAAAVWIDADGGVGAEDRARVDLARPGCVAWCCPRGAHFVLAYRLQLWAAEQPAPPDQAAVAARLETLAAEGGVDIRPHASNVQLALNAVARIKQTFDEMQRKGELQEINAEFKAARAADRSLRYADFIHGRKLAMLKAVAPQA